MCEKCKAIADEQNFLFEEMDANELVKMLAIILGTEEVPMFETVIALFNFESNFEDPVQVVALAHHFGVRYLAEKDRANKLQATLDMMSETQLTHEGNNSEVIIASKDREIAGLKSSLTMLMSAINLMSSKAGYKMPSLNSDDPMAVRQLLGAMADQLDDTKSRIEDMMRELSHRHNLATQPHKAFQSSN
ncbi:TPA: hypothetical protein LSH25_003874 [Escherichia coli]|nr:hypothetical protein [Escherichia coli]